MLEVFYHGGSIEITIFTFLFTFLLFQLFVMSILLIVKIPREINFQSNLVLVVRHRI